MATGFQQPLENEGTNHKIAQYLWTVGFGREVTGQTTPRGEGGQSPNSV